MAQLALLLLAFVPIMVWGQSRTRAPHHTWLATGVALGSIISPLSIGLYSTYFVGPLGLPTGMLGLVSSLFHGAPGYKAALWLGYQPNPVVSGFDHVFIEFLNGTFWASVYGLFGFALDWFRSMHSRRVA